jgi:glutamine synthetase
MGLSRKDFPDILPLWEADRQPSMADPIPPRRPSREEAHLALDDGPPLPVVRGQRAAQLGLGFRVGVELEFFLLRPPVDPAAPPIPIDHDLYAALGALSTARPVVDALAGHLWASGIPLAGYNAESGPGQHEISLAHTSPLALADRLASARGTIRAVAHEHGLVASFLPKVFADATGSGAHLHVSLWADGENVTPARGEPSGLSPRAQHFVAGILARLPALTALTTPSPNSFRRLQPHTWSGAFAAWGLDNKEAAVRVLAEAGGATRFELKTVDASANPYLAVGAVLAAGLHGIATAQRLGVPVQVDPGTLPADERQRLGIGRLPHDLGEALAALDDDPVLRDALGEELARVYACVRRAEHEALHATSLDHERALLLTRY